MRGALLIARKDLLRSVRDRSAIAVAIVAPLLLAFILSSVLPDDDDLGITYGYVNEDGGPLAQTFVTVVLEGIAEDFATIRELDSRADAVEAAADDEIAAAFVLEEGFSEAVQAGDPAALEVVANPVSEVGGPIARALADGYVAELDAIGLSIATYLATSGEEPSEEVLARVRTAAQALGPPATIEDRTTGDREFDDNTFFAAGMAVFFLFFTTQMGAQSLLRERREGTLLRLAAAPVSKRAILAGKAIFTYVLGVTSLVVLIAASGLVLGASWGNWLGVGLIVLAAVFAAMGVQSVATTLAKTDEQAAGFGSIVAVTLGLLGGTFFPLSQAPGFVANLSFVTPHAWIMRALGDLSGGTSTVSDVVPSLIALVVFGTVMGTIALVRVRRITVAA
ncbi:MAG TPA: ABC transporter permease [Actinomycetota bacterium]|jgi:ABC-2 type transport system permease protein